jgi:hypothetical protein
MQLAGRSNRLSLPEPTLTKNPHAINKANAAKPATNNKIRTIKCCCGAQIMLLPDLNAMNTAIEQHLAQHKFCTAEPSMNSLRLFLTKQVLIAAADEAEKINTHPV